MLSMRKIAFVDSGVGGLFFALDTISGLAKQYDISNLEFFHIGDTKNIPYGTKTNNEIKILIENLIKKAFALGAEVIILACNTGHVGIDDKIIDYCLQNAIVLITILEHSAYILYNNTQVINEEANTAILGTKSTINNNEYYNILQKIHANTAVKLNIIKHAPDLWVEKIEGDIDANSVKQFIFESLDKLRNQNQNFINITSLGLFCTQFVYFKNEITQYCRKYCKNEVFICSQGEHFAKNIANIIELTKSNNKPKNPSIASYITGNNIGALRSVINRFNQDIEVKFEKIII